ncbi:twin-arginine translocase TatA/TatE family subunit [Modestobacter altitudinis]|uniref:twin-arginine translocase TatA/TatE family subunit n=1 Tax=Modestobacter altitudinis TaxID=2213158 RepID=UPI00110D0833|nr:twin-arginine translocase TatA/TatE family subunit [Modestobacter altitudinis]
MNLGPAEIGLIVLAIMLLFGYKKLPDASRSLGRSLRIFKTEVNELRDDQPVAAVGGTPDTHDPASTSVPRSASAGSEPARPAVAQQEI